MKTRIHNLLAIAVLGCALVTLSGCQPNRVTSEGSRVGTVVKFSLKETGPTGTSYAPRCWEGELNMTIPGSAVMEKWLFSVRPEDTIAVDKVKAALRTRETVELQYRQWLFIPSESGSWGSMPLQGTLYSVYDVLPVQQ